MPHQPLSTDAHTRACSFCVYIHCNLLLSARSLTISTWPRPWATTTSQFPTVLRKAFGDGGFDTATERVGPPKIPPMKFCMARARRAILARTLSTRLQDLCFTPWSKSLTSRRAQNKPNRCSEVIIWFLCFSAYECVLHQKKNTTADCDENWILMRSCQD